MATYQIFFALKTIPDYDLLDINENNLLNDETKSELDKIMKKKFNNKQDAEETVDLFKRLFAHTWYLDVKTKTFFWSKIKNVYWYLDIWSCETKKSLKERFDKLTS